MATPASENKVRVDDPYFSAGSWPPDAAAGPEYADYPGNPEYADRGAIRPAGRQHGLAQPGNVWQRLAAAPWPVLEAPSALSGGLPAASGAPPPHAPGSGWPYVPLNDGPGPAAPRSGETPVTGQRFPSTRPAVGSPFGEYDSFPGHWPREYDGYDAGRPAALDSRPRDRRPYDQPSGTVAPRRDGSRRPGRPDGGPPGPTARETGTSLLAGPGPAAHRRARDTGNAPGSAALRSASYGRPRSHWLPFAAIASLVSFTAGALLALFPSVSGSPLLQAALLLAGLSSYAGGAAFARRTDRAAGLSGLSPFVAVCLAAGAAFLIGRLLA